MSRPLDPTTVVKTVATWYRLLPTTIMGHGRTPRVARARHVAMYLLREDGRSLTEVGHAFQRNHASVIYACTRIEELLRNNTEFVIDLNQIRERVHVAHNRAA